MGESTLGGTFWEKKFSFWGQILFHFIWHLEKHMKWIFNTKPPR
jgi:hypothetical protein